MTNYKHGHNRKNSPTYRSWLSMKRRCYDCNYPNWKYYGERGIKVCQRWKHTFKNFLDDMGERPLGKELDRIDTNGDYTQSNCRWISHKENMRNRRPSKNSRYITANGKTKTMSEWAEELGTSCSTITHRIKRHGWSEEKAVTTPIRKKHKKS